MNYATIKGEIIVPVAYNDNESLDWFIDNNLKITKSSFQAGICSLDVAKMLFEACSDAVFIDTYNELYKENFRFSMEYCFELGICGLVYKYPADFTEKQIFNKVNSYELAIGLRKIEDVYEAIDMVVEIFNSIHIESEFKNNETLDIVSATFDGDFNYEYLAHE